MNKEWKMEPSTARIIRRCFSFGAFIILKQKLISIFNVEAAQNRTEFKRLAIKAISEEGKNIKFEEFIQNLMRELNSLYTSRSTNRTPSRASWMR